MNTQKSCPNCGGPVGIGNRFCPHCGTQMAAARPAYIPPEVERHEQTGRSQFRMQGGLLLPGLYVPFGRQSPQARRWGWIIAFGLLLFALGPLLLSLLFGSFFVIRF